MDNKINFDIEKVYKVICEIIGENYNLQITPILKKKEVIWNEIK